MTRQTRIIAAAFVLSALSLATAEEQGVIRGNGVNVRSGPSRYGIVLNRLDEGQTVEILERRSDGWLAVRPTPSLGCYSVVAAQFVEPDASNPKYGQVTGNNVQVRAAGKLRTKDFFAVQGKLDRGQKVRIIGRVYAEDGRTPTHYVIRPPANARVYIAAEYVRAPGAVPPEPAAAPLTEAQPAGVEETADAPAATGEDAAVATDQPAETAEASADPVTGEPAPLRSVRSETSTLRNIRELEQALVAEAEKPDQQRDWPALRKQAEQIDVPPNSRFRPIYDSLLGYIDDEIALMKQRQEADALVQRILRTDEAAQAETPELRKPVYDLRGVLSVSVLYPPAVGEPKRYVLRDPQTNEITGYVQSGDNTVPLDRHVGKTVGVKGVAKYNRDLALNILEAKELQVLDQPTAPSLAANEPAPEKTEPPQPEPVEPEPVAEAPQPEPVQPEPVAETPQPQPVEPEPVAEAPQPQPVQPEPVAEAPQPVEPVQPEPVAEAPQPQPVEPEPVAETPQPQPVQPEPVAAQPEPDIIQPRTHAIEPTPIQPAEAPAPETPQPAPPGLARIDPEPLTPSPTPEEPGMESPTRAAPEGPGRIEPIAVRPTAIDEPDIQTPAPPKEEQVAMAESDSPPAEPGPSPARRSPTAVTTMKLPPGLNETTITTEEFEVEWD